MIITLFPLYWIVVTSLKEPGAIYTVPLSYWPEVFTLQNYEALFARSNFGRYVLNSAVVATVAGGAPPP